jgi:hypothetical protein
MLRPKRASSRGTPAQKERAKPVRQNEALLEVQVEAVPDAAIEGLVHDWIVPMIVDAIIGELFEHETNV